MFFGWMARAFLWFVFSKRLKLDLHMQVPIDRHLMYMLHAEEDQNMFLGKTGKTRAFFVFSLEGLLSGDGGSRDLMAGSDMKRSLGSLSKRPTW